LAERLGCIAKNRAQDCKVLLILIVVQPQEQAAILVPRLQGETRNTQYPGNDGPAESSRKRVVGIGMAWRRDMFQIDMDSRHDLERLARRLKIGSSI
jgi:hypothetical protein